MQETETLVATATDIEPMADDTKPVPSMPPALKKLDMHLPVSRPLGMNRAQRRRAARKKNNAL